MHCGVISSDLLTELWTGERIADLKNPNASDVDCNYHGSASGTRRAPSLTITITLTKTVARPKHTNSVYNNCQILRN